MINKRCLEILEYLIENDNTLELKEMALKYDISERSVRYDMDNINYFLKRNDLGQLEKKSKGIYSLDEKKENLKRIIDMLNVKFYTFSKSERINFIKAICFFGEEVIKLHEISEILSVSISTVKLDMKDVKVYLQENGLEIVPLSKQGLILKGSEEKIRKTQLKFLLSYVGIKKNKIVPRNKIKETYGVKLIVDEIINYFEDISIRDIDIFIKRIEKQMKIIVSDEAYKVLKLYIMLSILRLQEKHSIEEREENEKFLRQTKEFEVLTNELKHFEENFDLEFSDSELLLLTELFLGSHSYNFNTSFYKNWIEIEVSVHEMIKQISQSMKTDLTRDKILLDGLLNHIKPAIYRIKNGILLENEMSEEFKELYTDLFELVKNTCRATLNSYIGKDVTDEEVAFIAIHFKIALDRKSNIIKKTKNILLVCGFGYGSSKLLSQKLLEKYDVNILDTIPYHKFLEIKKYDDIDLIITTLEIEDKIDYPLPIIKVNPIFSKGDVKKLEEYGLTEVQKKIPLTKILNVIKKDCNITNEENLIKGLKDLLHSKLFDDREKSSAKTLENLLQSRNVKFLDRVDSWNQGIREAGKLLEDQGVVDSSYTKEMIEAVEKNGSYMVVAGKVALPHARVKDKGIKTGMALLRLKEPVIFPGGKKVELIIPFSSLDQSEHIEALTELMGLIEHQNFIEFINKAEDRDEINEFIRVKRSMLGE